MFSVCSKIGLDVFRHLFCLKLISPELKSVLLTETRPLCGQKGLREAMRLKISFGVPEDQRLRAAKILHEAFETKFKNVFGPRETGVPLISRHLRNDRVVVATGKGIVVGLAGLRFGGKSFIDVGFWDLLRELRFGILRLLLSSCCYPIFRQVWFSLNKPGENEILLEALAVAKDMRGKGVGSRLLKFIIDFGRSGGYEQIRLSVVDTNVKAKRFYERFGFEEVRVHRVLFPWNRILGFNAVSEMILRIQYASRRERRLTRSRFAI